MTRAWIPCRRRVSATTGPTAATTVFAERGLVKLLYENLALEVLGIAQFHEFVRVAGITVLTPELTASVGVDCPAKGQPVVRALA